MDTALPQLSAPAESLPGPGPEDQRDGSDSLAMTGLAGNSQRRATLRDLVKEPAVIQDHFDLEATATATSTSTSTPIAAPIAAAVYEHESSQEVVAVDEILLVVLGKRRQGWAREGVLNAILPGGGKGRVTRVCPSSAYS